jgi:hypothetical protein
MTSTDETKAVLDLLEAQVAMNAYQFFADVIEPPDGYKPHDGIGICFKVRGGTDGDPSVLMHPSFQFKIYGADEVACRAAARTLHDNFNEKADGNILAVYRETMPVTLKEPEEPNWTYALVFYKVMVRNLN